MWLLVHVDGNDRAMSGMLTSNMFFTKPQNLVDMILAKSSLDNNG